VSGRQVGDFLRADEVPRVLRALHPRWRPLFATALYTAMRKGELLSLQREDGDLDARAILVRRSWDRETTKDGHIDAIPVADDLLPWPPTLFDVPDEALAQAGRPADPLP
jgi:integrase